MKKQRSYCHLKEKKSTYIHYTQFIYTVYIYNWVTLQLKLTKCKSTIIKKKYIKEQYNSPKGTNNETDFTSLLDPYFK